MTDEIDFDKFARYGKPGPRYTSYPTAVEFSEAFAYEGFIAQLKSSNESGRPLSLYVHLPFCRSVCYFCGCNVIYTSKDEKKSRYIGYFERELEILSHTLDCSRPVVQLHFGGGTPTFFSASELAGIIKAIRQKFPNFTADAELSCEIDPRFFSEEHVKALTNGGFNRLSFGVQDFDAKVQDATHRLQSFELTANAAQMARVHGIKSLNFDLIYGLPHQNLATFADTLKKCVSLSPDRFAVFNYAHVPWMKKSMRKIDENTLPAPSEKLKILKHTIEFLGSHDYEMIGMDHFAKPDDELAKAKRNGQLHRNFQGYTTKGGSDLVGIGLTSISELGAAYGQNYKEMDEYEAAIDAGRLPYHRGVQLTSDDLLRKAVIMELMNTFALDVKKVERDFGVEFKSYFADSLAALKEYEDAGLLSVTDERLAANATGAMLIRNIAMCFDAYMAGKAGQKIFSKTV